MKPAAIVTIFGVALLGLGLGLWTTYWSLRFLAVADQYWWTVVSVERKSPAEVGAPGGATYYSAHIQIEDSRGRKWEHDFCFMGEGPDDPWPGRRGTSYEVTRLDRARTHDEVIRAEFFRFWWPSLGAFGLTGLAGWIGVRGHRRLTPGWLVGVAAGLLAGIGGYWALVSAWIEPLIFWSE